MRCIGDPFGVGADCLAPATAFVFGAIPDPEDVAVPIFVALPCCDAHAHVCADWIASNSPLGESFGYPIEALGTLQETMARAGDGLWLYERSAA